MLKGYSEKAIACLKEGKNVDEGGMK